MINIIVAYDEEFAIGKDGNLPWSVPQDLKHFQQMTFNKAVLMGRKTWDSLPPQAKPLPGRLNMVLSRTKRDIPLYYSPREPYWACSFKDATRQITAVSQGIDVFIIGGAEVFRQALDAGVVERVIASEMKGTHEGDTFFPNLLEDGWKTVGEPDVFDDFKIVEYEKP